MAERIDTTSPAHKGRLLVAAMLIGLAVLTFLGVRYVASPTSEKGKDSGVQAAGLQPAMDGTAAGAAPITKNQQSQDTLPTGEKLSRDQVDRPIPAKQKSLLSVSEIESEERKHPEDYHLPYERAKKSINGTHSHDEAIDALFLAAEKAIDGGHSAEMLADLMSDKDGSLSKVSRGHTEWRVLENALRTKDKNLLREMARR